MHLALIGKQITNGKITLTIEVEAETPVTGLIRGIPIHGGGLSIETEDGKRVLVKATQVITDIK